MNNAWTVQFNLAGDYLITPPPGVSLDELERFIEVKRAVSDFVTQATGTVSRAA